MSYEVRKSFNGQKLVIMKRHFDGIETNYDDKVILKPDEARFIGQELMKLAESIDGKSKKDRTFAKIRKAVAAAADEARQNCEVPGQ